MEMALLHKSLQFENCERAEIIHLFIFQTESIVNSEIKWVNHIHEIRLDVTYVSRQTNAKNRKSQDWLQWLGHIFSSSLYFLLRYFALVLADMSNLYTQEVWSQGKTMSRRRGEESCPFLDGVYVSVMRRFEPLELSLKFITVLFHLLWNRSPQHYFHSSQLEDHQSRLPQAAPLRGGVDAHHNSPSWQVAHIHKNWSIMVISSNINALSNVKYWCPGRLQIFRNTNHHDSAIFHSHQLSNQVHSLGRGDNSPRSFRRPWRDEGSQVCQHTLTKLPLVYELFRAHRNVQAQNWPAHIYPLQSWYRKTRVWVRGLQVGC